MDGIVILNNENEWDSDDAENSLYEEPENDEIIDKHDNVADEQDDRYDENMPALMSNERGYAGSRHDFKRTKPMFTDEQFIEKDLYFRIGAILSDGQWYDADKIRKIAHETSLEPVQDIIDDMLENDLIVSSDSSESYRMTYDQLHEWRYNHHIPLDAQIVQSILYPRLITIGRKTITEQEVFLPVKRHRFGSVKFTLVNSDDIHDILDNLRYIGQFINIGENRWTVICLSADWAKKKLEDYEKERGGKGKVFALTGRPNIYNNGLQRDLNEIDHRAIDQIVRFYLTFQTVSSTGELRPAILQPSSYKTLKVYLDDGNGDSDVISQLNKWIIWAIQHYDEKCGSPFAAYLQMIANNRVNDIPKTVIGDELAKFQNMKAKAVKALNKKYSEGEWYTVNQIIDMMHRNYPDYQIDEKKYSQLDEELKTWQQMKHMSSLEWTETGEEKRFNDEKQDLDDAMLKRNSESSRIQHAIVKATILSGKTIDGRLMLMMLNHSSSLGSALMSSMSAMLTDDYRDSLAIVLSTMKN